jgi:hypothetical protein
MTSLSANEYATILRNDFYTFMERSFYQLNPDVQFIHNWHIEKIAAELEACRRGETKRLIICVPPRSLKSHGASFPPGFWPTTPVPRSFVLPTDRISRTNWRSTAVR